VKLNSTVLCKTSSHSIRVVQCDTQFDLLESDWNALYRKSKLASAPLRFEWQREWWRVFGVKYGPDGLRILIAENKEGVAGILPLYVAPASRLGARRLHFISTGEAPGEVTYPEYNGFLANDDCCEQIFRLFTSTVFEQKGLLWDELHMGIIGSNSPVIDWFSGDRTSGKFKTTVKKRNFKAPYADLTGGFDVWLKKRSANARQQFRSLMRKAEKAGVSLQLAKTKLEARDYLKELADLHTLRWQAVGKNGAFSSQKLIQFHTSVAEKLVPKEEAYLSRLSVGGKPLALLYGFRVNDKFDFYQSGIALEDKAGPVKQPGILAHLLMMRALAEKGVTTYDFLAGDSDYKKRLASAEQDLIEVSLRRATIPAFLSLAVSQTKRGSRKLQSLLNSKENKNVAPGT